MLIGGKYVTGGFTCVGDTIVIIIKIIHVWDAIIVIIQVNGVVNTIGIRVTGLEQTTLGIFSPLMRLT